MYLNDRAVEAIEAILKKGDKAVVQRSKDGVLIMSEHRKIQYSTAPSRER